MMSHGEGRVHEDGRHRCQVLNTLHLEPEQVSIDGVSVNGLRARHSMTTHVSWTQTLLSGGAHVVRGLLMCLCGLTQQRQPFRVLWETFPVQSGWVRLHQRWISPVSEPYLCLRVLHRLDESERIC